MARLKDIRAKKIAEYLARQAADPANSPRAFINEQERMRSVLNQHQLRLSKINSRERRIELKTQLVSEYQPYLEGILAADEGGQDAVVTTLMLWFFDIGDYDYGLQLADYASRHDVAMPKLYERELATVIAGELSDAYLGESATKPAAEHLAKALELVADADIPDNVNARLHKAYANTIEALQPATALEHYNRALELDARCGCKKNRDALEKRLQKPNSETEEKPTKKTKGGN